MSGGAAFLLDPKSSLEHTDWRYDGFWGLFHMTFVQIFALCRYSFINIHKMQSKVLVLAKLA
jgi:hypothetical protein